MGYMFTRGQPGVDRSPNDILVRRLMSSLRDGYTFKLADAYSDPWDTVQVFTDGQPMTEWEWRTLRAFDPTLTQQGAGWQLLVFWREGGITQTVRLEHGANGAPWFAVDSNAAESLILSREKAVFRAALVREGDVAYYLCTPETGTIQI